VYDTNRIWSDAGVGPVGESDPTAHLADLIDPQDPAFSEIMQAAWDFRSSGIGLSEGTVQMAIQLGRHKRERQERVQPPVRTDPNIHPPVVYYIRRGATVKIGTTTNLRQRMAALLPEEILATEPGGYELEAQRHRQFQDLRIDKREWFHAGPRLQRHILTVRATHGAPDPTLPVLSNS
jgi:hypothetical protein